MNNLSELELAALRVQMDKVNTLPPSAFPLVINHGANHVSVVQGLTKREYFAAAALMGLCTIHDGESPKVARIAVRRADFLIAELDKAKIEEEESCRHDFEELKLHKPVSAIEQCKLCKQVMVQE